MRFVLGFYLLLIVESSMVCSMVPDDHKVSTPKVHQNGNGCQEKMVIVEAQALLNWAVENNNVEYAEKALKVGASVIQALPFCATPTMLDFLMKNGLHLTYQQILDWAVFRNDENLTLKMIAYGAQPDKALKYCVKSSMLTTLVSGGLVVDGIIPSLGRTPLYYFLEPLFPIDVREQENILNTLLLLGADPNFVITGIDQYGKSLSRTALHKAVYLKKLDLVQLLVEKKAALNVQDNNGSTPLHIAIKLGAWDIIKYLVDSGASLSVKDNNGATPYDLALQNELYDIIEYCDRAHYIRSQQVITVSPEVQTSTSSASVQIPQTVPVLFPDMNSQNGVPQASSTSSTNSSTASSMTASSDQVVVISFSPTFNEQSARRSSEEHKEQSTVTSADVWLRRPSNLWRSIVRIAADSWESQTQDHAWKPPQ